VNWYRVWPKLLRVTEGEAVVISCLSSTIPYWSLQDNAIKTFEKKKSSANTFQLVIKKAKVNDTGFYVCEGKTVDRNIYFKEWSKLEVGIKRKRKQGMFFKLVYVALLCTFS